MSSCVEAGRVGVVAYRQALSQSMQCACDYAMDAL